MTISPSEQYTSEDLPTPRLHRSVTDRACFGVCGGLAECLAVDSSLARMLFVVATLWGGLGLLLYVVLAIILPAGDSVSAASARRSVERSHVLAGLVLIGLGGLLLAGNMGLTPWLTWNLFWPGVLILVGVGLLVRQPGQAHVTY